MKTVGAGLKAVLVSGDHAIAQCLKLTLTNGDILGATTHDQNLVIGGVTYLASAGGTSSDVENTATLAVQNSEMRGLIDLDSITTVDLRAGLYDYARVSIFAVNWRDLSQGTYSQIDGWLGQVTAERTTFIAELRGLAQALTRTLGRLCTPTCTANLGDSRCKVDLNGSDGNSPVQAFTVTGTIEDVSDDNATMFDSARTEVGTGNTIAISAITNDNPGLVVTVTPLTVPNGTAVTMSGIIGPSSLNGVTVVRNKVGNQFSLGIDTTDTSAYPIYVGGGIVNEGGGDAGWFAFGLFTATSGLNNGLSMPVKSSAAGQFTLQLPMPYQMAIGDTYTLVVGCDKLITTCNTKFSNSANFRGRPYVPGQDQLVQVGRKQ